MSERICEHFAKTLRKTMRERVPHLQDSKKGTKSGRLRRPLCVRVFRVSEGWNALAHILSRGFCKMLTSFFRQKITKNTILSPTSYRLYSTSFVKTNAPGGLPSSGAAVLNDFVKTPSEKPNNKHDATSPRIRSAFRRHYSKGLAARIFFLDRLHDY